MLERIYKAVQEKHETLDFQALWPGFHSFPFALYDGNRAYGRNGYFPQPEAFRGNTALNYHGEWTAVWKLTPAETPDIHVLSADLVHEMFHAFQMECGERRFPDDLAALAYPMDAGNLTAKLAENRALAAAFAAPSVSEKVWLLARFAGIRRTRGAALKECFMFELFPETVEGMAEYIGAQALARLSPEAYTRRTAFFIEALTRIAPALLDMRRQAYFSGALLLLTAHAAGIDFAHGIATAVQPVYRLIEDALKMQPFSEYVLPDPDPALARLAEEEAERRRACIAHIQAAARVRAEGEFSICGYDPMNMWRLGPWLYGKHFWKLREKGSGRTYTLTGPSLLRWEAGAVCAYCTDAEDYT